MTTQALTFPPELEALFLPPFDAPRRYGWSVTIGGRPWSVATDGRSLLAVPVASELPAQDSGDQGEPKTRSLAAILDAPAAGAPVLTTAEELRAWCGPVPEPRDEACGCCGGSGKCVCDQCDVTHECGCCQGSGRQEVYEHRPQAVAGVLVDAGRLARLLEGRSGTCTATRRPMPAVEGGAAVSAALRLDGDGWFGLVMEMKGPLAGRPEFGADQLQATQEGR